MTKNIILPRARNATEIARQWEEELPYQFHEKPNLQSVIRSYSTELAELNKAFHDVKYLTDIDNATGRTLDYVGEIVGLSRRDAVKLLELTKISDITDEVYRNVLRFELLRKNSDARYSDIMKGLHILWGDEAQISYEENPITDFLQGYGPPVYDGTYTFDDGVLASADSSIRAWNKPDPATIRITIDGLSTDSFDPLLLQPMVIRGGGVKLIFKTVYKDPVDMSSWEKFCNFTYEEVHFHKYNGALQYNGKARYTYYDLAYRNMYSGVFQYNNKAQYNGSASGYGYTEYDGMYQYDAERQYGFHPRRRLTRLGDAVLLNQAKAKMLELRFTGANPSWKIAGMAFGTGLAPDGADYTPDATQTALRNEIYRKPLYKGQKLAKNRYRYACVLEETECNDNDISEIGLYDTDGMLLCIKTFPKKKKRKTNEMMFQFDDMF